MPLSFVAITHALRASAVVALALLTLGCSSNEPFEEPDPLPEIVESVELEEVWSRSIGDGMDGKLLILSPAIVGDSLYAVDAEGELYALDARTGEQIWYRDLSRSILAGVGADQSQLYLVGRNGELLALDRENGELNWSASLPAEVLAPPQSNGTQVVVATIDGSLIAFDAAAGQRLWRYDSTSPVLSYRGTAVPYIDDERVLAGFSNGMLMSIDVLTGAPLWEYAVSVAAGRTELERLVDIDGRPLVLGDTVLVAGYQGKLAALSLETGQEFWSRETSSLQSPGVGKDRVFVAEADGTLISYNAFSRAEGWRIDTLSWRRLTAPVTYDDLVVVGDYEGYLHLVRQADGEFVARVQVDSDGLRVPPLRFEDLLIVYGNGGELVAYRLPDAENP
jgi:outer membrane protein assembly factor BamB